jgi:mevalonate kinase
LKKFRSNGKLLITSEYLVLDGAEAFAIPSKLGQTLSVENYKANEFKQDILIWMSYDIENQMWFNGQFDEDFNVLKSSDSKIADTLSLILKVASYLNPEFSIEVKGKLVKTHLEFPRDWGLGSSSTLINNIAQWAMVDPFELQKESFPGSGYDIACALSNRPLIYQIQEGNASYISIDYDSSLKDKMLFVHLNKKQNSSSEVKSYKQINFDRGAAVCEFNEITRKVVSCKDLKGLRELLTIHENKLAEILGVKTVKQSLFPDFKGVVKSLGAWGGDFVLAIGDNSEEYFKSKGFKTLFRYQDLLM